MKVQQKNPERPRNFPKSRRLAIAKVRDFNSRTRRIERAFLSSISHLWQTTKRHATSIFKRRSHKGSSGLSLLSRIRLGIKAKKTKKALEKAANRRKEELKKQLLSIKKDQNTQSKQYTKLEEETHNLEDFFEIPNLVLSQRGDSSVQLLVSLLKRVLVAEFTSKEIDITSMSDTEIEKIVKKTGSEAIRDMFIKGLISSSDSVFMQNLSFGLSTKLVSVIKKEAKMQKHTSPALKNLMKKAIESEIKSIALSITEECQTLFNEADSLLAILGVKSKKDQISILEQALSENKIIKEFIENENNKYMAQHLLKSMSSSIVYLRSSSHVSVHK